MAKVCATMPNGSIDRFSDDAEEHQPLRMERDPGGWLARWAVLCAFTVVGSCGGEPEPGPRSAPAAEPSVGFEAEQEAYLRLARVDREILADRIRGLRALKAISGEQRRERDACLEGRMNACESLGDAYSSGIGAAADAEAAKLFHDYMRLLAKAYCEAGGDTIHGCSQLGRIYYEGLGTARREQRGIELLRRGCAGGDDLACMYLGNEGLSESGS